jgi:hypothetical protein
MNAPRGDVVDDILVAVMLDLDLVVGEVERLVRKEP